MNNLSKDDIGFTKKEVLKLGKERDKLTEIFRRNLRYEKNSRYDFYN